MRCTNHKKHTDLAADTVAEAATPSASITTDCPPRSKVAGTGCLQLLIVFSFEGGSTARTLTGDPVEPGENGRREPRREDEGSYTKSPLGTSFSGHAGRR